MLHRVHTVFQFWYESELLIALIRSSVSVYKVSFAIG